ncbi:PHD finger protein ALFIN-LIKE 1-like [Daphnia pulex]|uniref:PHD finger protein ALFIN-LIKE 1-like n=1 Tax=Daphnia pulex TaxID=6669 RepID=UPI001EDF67B1|nr:PHD finger protein ALFIN-LIKE 1-like [Daphnia pulex]
MVNGVEERNTLPPVGRNMIDNSKRISNTQERRKEVEHAMYYEELCGLNTCGNFLGEEFAILCVSCKVWFHGSCVNISRKIATTLEKKKFEWSCDIYISAPVTDKYPAADGSPPEKS